jgi:transposase InsO family protein
MVGVSRSGYYAWCNRPESARTKQNKLLTQTIAHIFTGSRQTYGYRRVHQAMKQQGQTIGKHRVARLMRKATLVPKTKRKFKATTHSNHQLPIYQNVLQRKFMPAKPNQVWSSDITYVWTGEGWLYLAVVLDLFSRQIIGWSMQNRMTEDLVVNALKMALFRRKILTPLLFHSDRGSQYASYAFQRLLAENNISCSMSRKGNCWDNSPTESFFGSLKVECLYQQSIKTREEAQQTIFDYIEVFYNRQRLHSTLNYLSPVDYEKSVENL